MSKPGIAERYVRGTRQLKIESPEPARPPAEEILPYPPLETPKQRRLKSQIGTIVRSTFAAIGDNQTLIPLKRKYCDKLRSMGVPESDLHPWCHSAEADYYYPGPAVETTLDALAGGRSRRKRRRHPKKTMKKNRKRMTRKK